MLRDIRNYIGIIDPKLLRKLHFESLHRAKPKLEYITSSKSVKPSEISSFVTEYVMKEPFLNPALMPNEICSDISENKVNSLKFVLKHCDNINSQLLEMLILGTGLDEEPELLQSLLLESLSKMRGTFVSSDCVKVLLRHEACLNVVFHMVKVCRVNVSSFSSIFTTFVLTGKYEYAFAMIDMARNDRFLNTYLRSNSHFQLFSLMLYFKTKRLIEYLSVIPPDGCDAFYCKLVTYCLDDGYDEMAARLIEKLRDTRPQCIGRLSRVITYNLMKKHESELLKSNPSKKTQIPVRDLDDIFNSLASMSSEGGGYPSKKMYIRLVSFFCYWNQIDALKRIFSEVIPNDRDWPTKSEVVLREILRRICYCRTLNHYPLQPNYEARDDDCDENLIQPSEQDIIEKVQFYNQSLSLIHENGLDQIPSTAIVHLLGKRGNVIDLLAFIFNCPHIQLDCQYTWTIFFQQFQRKGFFLERDGNKILDSRYGQLPETLEISDSFGVLDILFKVYFWMSKYHKNVFYNRSVFYSFSSAISLHSRSGLEIMNISHYQLNLNRRVFLDYWQDFNLYLNLQRECTGKLSHEAIKEKKKHLFQEEICVSQNHFVNNLRRIVSRAEKKLTENDRRWLSEIICKYPDQISLPFIKRILQLQHLPICSKVNLLNFGILGSLHRGTHRKSSILNDANALKLISLNPSIFLNK